jgi:hypothetical protein
MKTVDVHELRDWLSEYLREARSGVSLGARGGARYYPSLARQKRGKRNSLQLLEEERGPR